MLVEGCKFIIAEALPKVNKVLIAGVPKGTAGAIETWESGGGAISFTLSDILREAGMQLPTGVRKRFPVQKVSKSPIGPAVAIDLAAKPLETQRVETKRKKKST